MIYASLAVPYSLLDAEPSALYRPPLRKGESDRLFDLAIQSLPVTPTSIGAIDALLGCIIYLVYAGQGLQIKELTVPAMEFAMKLGMFDESSESWRDLDHTQRNHWRRVAWSLYTACRWVWRIADPRVNADNQVVAYVCRGRSRPAFTSQPVPARHDRT